MTEDRPDVDALLAEHSDLITAAATAAGCARADYEVFLTQEPDPGQTWESALVMRLGSMAAGPLPVGAAREIASLLPTTTTQEKATGAAA